MGYCRIVTAKIFKITEYGYKRERNIKINHKISVIMWKIYFCVKENILLSLKYQ